MAKPYNLRIQAGTLKGRVISSIPSHIRPTGQRTRETLFNWLTPYIQGAKCLDLFGGSGILSFEALSRGAASSLCLDQDINTIKHIEQHASLFHLDTLKAQKHTLPNPFHIETCFDVVFIDPPFNLLSQDTILTWLQDHIKTHKDTLYYLERPAKEPRHTHWIIHREKKHSQVRFGLYQINSDSEAS